MYHKVFPAKYRRKVFSQAVADTLKEVCLGIGQRYEIQFIEIGMDEDHIHFLLQSVPVLSVSQIVTTLKSITAKQIFAAHPEVKKLLWGGKFWTSGYYANTVGQYGTEEVIRKYVENQGRKYQKIHTGQLSLF